ncbi:hypothetical protein PISMIDRAFT_353611 [Pisolithus microcarpus 441]|uniref:Uncharacterized protein n=1 Tax=Pisolithus microcarpus 441 TaxID=765257 RepID=A0A0C9Z7A3_9AGAM|nr:hypothetical protein PISMIDRAFT_353611 [Pisolithus microcarpus 441]
MTVLEKKEKKEKRRWDTVKGKVKTRLSNEATGRVQLSSNLHRSLRGFIRPLRHNRGAESYRPGKKYIKPETNLLHSQTMIPLVAYPPSCPSSPPLVAKKRKKKGKKRKVEPLRSTATGAFIRRQTACRTR